MGSRTQAVEEGLQDEVFSDYTEFGISLACPEVQSTRRAEMQRQELQWPQVLHT